MFEFAIILLGLGLVGLVSSSVYLVLALVGVGKFRRGSREQQQQAKAAAAEGLPGVSVLKPLHGAEVQLEQNLESFFTQDYGGPWEVIFAVDRADDKALPVARRVCAKFPDVPSRVLVTGDPLWPNPPAFSFSCMAEVAQYRLLITSDSDVEVEADYLSSLAPPLCRSKIGMVTCVYRGLARGGLWSELDAIGMSVEMTAGVLAANLLEGMKFGLGPTIAVRRDALDSIGGYQALGSYFSNDFAIGNFIAANGFQVVLSSHVISHVVPPMTFRKMWQRQVRWATGTRHSRPKGHFGTVFVFSVPYGLLALAGASLAGHAGWGTLLLAIALLNRLIENYAIGWAVTRDRNCLRKPWLYPLRDLLGFAVWVASYLSRNMRWRDGRFELVKGGLIRVRAVLDQEPVAEHK